MPPRHGKSELISKYLPAWVIGALREKVILTCYGSDFAKDWSIKARDLFYAHASTVFDAKVKEGLDTAEHWESTTGGVMYSAGAGGPITGRGADWLIIDDPIKNAEEAYSEVERNKLDEWYRTTAYTRLEPGGVVIMMMTRWHEDDLVGRRLASDEDDWRVINFPAISETQDALGRKPGEALWPARYPIDELRKIELNVGPRVWSAMYQQRPTGTSGNKIQDSWWQSYEELPSDLERIVVSWDTAWSTKESNDFSVAAVWGVNRSGYYLLEVRRDRVEFPELLQWAKRLSERYPNCLHLIEDAASGRPLGQMLRSETRVPVRLQTVQTDKVARLNAIIHNIEEGRCFLPTRATWLEPFLDEHRRFPNSRKDQVDTTSLVLAYFTERYPKGNALRKRVKSGFKESAWHHV